MFFLLKNKPCVYSQHVLAQFSVINTMYKEQESCSAKLQQLESLSVFVKLLHPGFKFSVHIIVLHDRSSVADPMQFPVPTTPPMQFL